MFMRKLVLGGIIFTFGGSPAVLFAQKLNILAPQPAKNPVEDQLYYGSCDASAAVGLSQTLFAIADDERNQIQVYQYGLPNPVQVLSVSEVPKEKEFDLEGGTTHGELQIWLGSHSRKKSGSAAPSRQVMLATTWQNGKLKRVGRVYRNLLLDLVKSPALKAYDLAGASEHAPETAEGLNIEEIASDGKLVWIGLRGPLFDDKALLVAIGNPKAVLLEKAAPQVAKVVTLDLGGRGVRGMSYDQKNRKFVIAAGAYSDEINFALYEWQPGRTATLKKNITGDFRPESLWWQSAKNETILMMASDDGSRVLDDNQDCRDLPNKEQHFRVRQAP